MIYTPPYTPVDYTRQDLYDLIRDQGNLIRAMEFLVKRLQDRAVPHTQLNDEWVHAGIPLDSIREAKDRLEIVTFYRQGVEMWRIWR